MLMAKRPSYVEIINDLNDDIINLFNILRDPILRQQLIEEIELTPYSRKEHELSYYPCEDVLEKTRRFLIRSNQGWQGRTTKSGWKTGEKEFRSIHIWTKLPQRLTRFAERLKNVQIECRPAVEIIEKRDTPDTFHFIDPPYPEKTLKQKRRGYLYHMTDREHEELIDLILGLKGKVLITMNENSIYDKLLQDNFRKDYIDSIDCRQQPRFETIYRNFEVYGPLFRS